MEKSDLRYDDNVFIVKVTGSSSKTINIPNEVCEFCNVNNGDLIKLKLLDVKKGDKKKK